MMRLIPGEPCEHPGCLSHFSHPCEGCGRIGGRGKSYRLGSVEFGEPAAYGGIKRICVSVRREDYSFSHIVLHLIKVSPGRRGWIAIMPTKTGVVGRSWTIMPERKLCNPTSLKMVRVKVARLVMAAGNDNRLEELRTAEVVPEWANDV